MNCPVLVILNTVPRFSVPSLNMVLYKLPSRPCDITAGAPIPLVAPAADWVSEQHSIGLGVSGSEKRKSGVIKQVEMHADLLGYLAPANIQAELKSYPGGSVAGRDALWFVYWSFALAYFRIGAVRSRRLSMRI